MNLPLLQGNGFLVIGVMVLVAVLMLAEGGWLLWREHRGPRALKLRSRLRTLAAVHDASAPTQVLRQRLLSELPLLDRSLQRLPHAVWADRWLLQSGTGWTVGRLLSSCGLLALLAGGTAGPVLRLGWALAAAAALLCAALPVAWVRQRRAARLRRLEHQLPDALDLMTRALRAGHAFNAALRMAGEEMPEPVAAELRTVHDEINFGVAMPQALAHLAERVPVTDLRYFVVAVLVQRESGGNLSEILGQLSRLIRERLRLLARIRVLSAEGRLSAWILGLMPFALAGLLSVFNPAFMTPLWTDPLGLTLIKLMLGMMAVGVLMMRFIIRVRV